ncbi:MAG: hypothetical protein FWG81_02255 [Betaproteobacteria bacterium]|nr:hypothetical protein [Betaproteobacteria bacterium]
MANNLEEFRSKFLTAARNRLLAYDPMSASEADLVIQSAVLKAYDVVDQYQVLTPERTSALLAMSQSEFNLWLADPVDAARNRIALAKTLAVPEAVEIIFADATAAENIMNSQIALATIFYTPETLATVISSPAAMTALVASPVAIAALADSRIALEAAFANPVATATVTASMTMMAALAESATALHVIAQDESRRTAFANSPHLEGQAQTIYATLNGAANFTRRANGSSLTNVRGAYRGVVGINTANGNYQATTTTDMSLYTTGKLFVYIRTLGYINASYTGNVQIYAKHLQTATTVGSKAHDGGSYTAQVADFICVGGAILDGSGLTISSAQAGMVYDCWEAQ